VRFHHRLRAIWRDYRRRLGYVFFYKPEMLREPLSILRVWEGGMSSHGGMLGLLLFTLYYAHRHKISWTNLGDNLL
jgi:phosphatidylglycerol:prolipoprotein diacylglycerol transferase